MCGKYTLMVANMAVEMARLVEICNETAELRDRILHANSGEISPDDAAPVLMVADGRLSACAMRWGFLKTDGGRIINARSETAAEKAIFSNSERCAIPAAGYFEWRGDGQKYLVSDEKSGGFYMAGLYRVDRDGRRRFVVLTRNAFGAHARIHSRMPLVLSSGEAMRKWLSGEMPLPTLADARPEGLTISAVGAEQLEMPLWDY